MTAETLRYAFFKIKSIFFFWFLCHSTCESLPIDVSITTCMTDIDEAKWFQYFSTSQNSISTFYEKKINFLGFRAVALVKTFPLMYQLLM